MLARDNHAATAFRDVCKVPRRIGSPRSREGSAQCLNLAPLTRLMPIIGYIMESI
ncbi:hypothetical protein QBC99_002093 [Beijerinckia sp. GAS462]|nr:hypothetical protein [Beijerinckia sp. GAS462]SEC27207.1 hypothetical protein SAMN05443249_2308 [Beijerinckia sp. 28-YEA-48]